MRKFNVIVFINMLFLPLHFSCLYDRKQLIFFQNYNSYRAKFESYNRIFLKLYLNTFHGPFQIF